MRRIRVLSVIALSCAVWWACTEGTDPTAAGRSVAVGVVPSFAIDPSLFATSPIDRIRLQARDAATRVVVGATDRSVSPTATQWSLSLGIDLGGQATRLVIVEAELFSGSTVVWSGRLGPFTAPSAVPALALNIFPGPLDNLDVLTLDVLGAPSQLVAGASVPLTAQLTLATGSDAAPVVQWASTNPTVATVSPAGSPVTLTAVTAGTATIVASAGAQDHQFALQVLPAGTATKTWVGGAAGAARSWSEPSNWSPTGVPTASDGVSIPATANNPLLSAAASVKDLTVQSGAVLDLGDFSIQVSGNIQAPGQIQFGTVVVGGSGTVLTGNVDGLFVSQSRSASGPVTAAGDLEVAAPFTVGAQTISVGGTLSVLSGGRLVMTNTSSIVRVTGDAIFAGDSEEGFLTAGNLIVDGDFIVGGSTPTAFAASGTHSVGFGGTALQSIGFEQPGPSASHFNTVFVDNGDVVDLVSDAYAAGNVVVSSTLIVPSSLTFGIGGTLTLESGSVLQVDGSVTAASCVNQGGTITGSGTQPCGTGPAATRTWVGGASGDANNWQNAGNWNPPGVPGPSDTLLIQASSYNPTLTANASIAAVTLGTSNTVNLAGYTLQISGDVNALNNYFTGGTVEVTGAGNILEGYFDNLRVSAARSLSNTIYVSGSLELLAPLDVKGYASWVAGDLLVNGSGKLVMTDGVGRLDVYGSATFNGADHTGALIAGTLSVYGDLWATDASPTSFVSEGTHELVLNGYDQAVTFEVPGRTQQRVNDLIVNTISRVTFASGVHVSGDLTTIGYMVVPAGTTLTIDGTLDLTSGSVLEVNGSVVAGACVATEAWVFGTGTPPCGTPITVDRVWLGGDTNAPQDWGTAANWAPVGVPAPTESILIPYREYQPLLSTDTPIATLLVHYSGYLNLGGRTLTVQDDVNVRGYVDNGLIRVTGAGTKLQGYLDGLRLEAPRSVSGFLSVNGNADVQARLTIGPQTVYVFGDLSVTGTGELALVDASAFVAVEGNTTLDGVRADLLGGDLYLYGNLTANAPMSTGAAIWLYGAAAQTVTLGNPGVLADQQHFAELYVANSGGVVTFASDVYVTQSLYVANSTIARTGNAILEVRGSLGAYTSTFSGVPVRLDSTVPPANHVLSGLTFSGYPATATQLYVRLPGTSGQSLTLSSPTFSSAPTPFSGYYIEAVNSLGVGVPALQITLTSPSPSTAVAGTTKVDTNSAITWGP